MKYKIIFIFTFTSNWLFSNQSDTMIVNYKNCRILLFENDSTHKIIIKTNLKQEFIYNVNIISYTKKDGLGAGVLRVRYYYFSNRVKYLSYFENGIESGLRLTFRIGGTVKSATKYENDVFKYVKFKFTKKGTSIGKIYDNY